MARAPHAGQWQKGQSGNPEGRPESRPFLGVLRRAIAQNDGVKLRECAEKLLDLASKGEPWAVQMLADRLDGKACQQIDMHVTDNRAEELSDSELVRLATAGSARTSETAVRTPEPSSVH